MAAAAAATQEVGGLAAGGGQGAQVQAMGEEEAAEVRHAWRRLWEAPVPNQARALVWRLMHGRLPCGAYAASLREQYSGMRARYACPNAACREARAPAADNLTHIFTQCPAYAAAREWLADLWQAVSGHRPPLTAAVLMADCSSAWPQHPSSPSLAELWSAVRISWLHAVWLTHRQPNASQRHSNAVVGRAVATLREQMRVRFGWCDIGSQVLDHLPTRLGRSPAKQMAIDKFRSCWAHGGVLCQTSEAANGALSLVVKLTMVAPVPAPLPPPPPPGGEPLEEDAGGEDFDAALGGGGDGVALFGGFGP